MDLAKGFKLFVMLRELVLQFTKSVVSNPADGRTKLCQLKIFTLTLLSLMFRRLYYTDISCLGGVFAKNTSRKTNNFPSRMASEI